MIKRITVPMWALHMHELRTVREPSTPCSWR